MSHEATIARVFVHPHPNAERLQLGSTCGYQVIVGPDVRDGELGIVFPEGCAIDRSFCLPNGLYRKHPDTGEALGGYLDESGRVRAVKLRGEVSDALWLPLSSLERWCGAMPIVDEGASFDSLLGRPLCRKYYTPATLRAMGGRTPTVRRAVADALPRHYDTAQLRTSRLPHGDLYVSEKIHGTSGRTGRVSVEQPLGAWARLWNRIAPRRWAVAPRRAWQYVSGTRNCVLDPAAPGEKGQAYRQTIHDRIVERGLRDGEVVYYEIFGFTHTGAPIMAPHHVDSLGDPKLEKALRKQYGERLVYSYGRDPDGPPDERFGVLVYRVEIDGRELPWIEVEARALQLGFDVPAWRYQPAGTWTQESARDLADAETRKPSAYSTAHPREGVCLRVETTDDAGATTVHRAVKHKGFVFCALEGIARNDAAFVDAEEVA